MFVKMSWNSFRLLISFQKFFQLNLHLLASSSIESLFKDMNVVTLAPNEKVKGIIVARPISIRETSINVRIQHPISLIIRCSVMSQGYNLKLYDEFNILRCKN